MKFIARFTLIGAAGLIASCGKNEIAQEAAPEVKLPVTEISEAKPAVNYITPGAIWKETHFTEWMSRAELQFQQENNPPDQYFAHVEGRSNAGRIEYRAVLKPFDTSQYEQWAVFWGISESELFDWELRLLKTGFVRKDMQAFADPTGKPLYQIVWLKPKEKPEEQERALAAVTVDEMSVEHLSIPAAPVEVPPILSESISPEKPTAAIEPQEPELPVRAAPKPPRTLTYIVQPGDTLGKIAKRRGVTVSDLKSVNGLKSDILRIGQKLTIAKSR